MGKDEVRKKVEKKRRKKEEWNKKLKSKVNREKERKSERERDCACKWNIRKANRYFTTFPIAVNVVFTLFDLSFVYFIIMKDEDRPLIHLRIHGLKIKLERRTIG